MGGDTNALGAHSICIMGMAGTITSQILKVLFRLGSRIIFCWLEVLFGSELRLMYEADIMRKIKKLVIAKLLSPRGSY